MIDALAVVLTPDEELAGEPRGDDSEPSGHDAWVVGDEPVVVVDWYGASNYARAGAAAASAP